MENNNVLDSEEKELSFLYGNRALYCLALSLLLFVGTGTVLVLSFIQDIDYQNFFLLVSVLIGGGIALMGCYLGIQGTRFRETKLWRSILGLVGNLLFVLMFSFLYVFAFTSVETAVEHRMPPVQENTTPLER